jgi:uncharacterized membrane protein
MEMRRFIWFVAGVGIFFNFLDALSTFVALTYFGLVEANPFMAVLFSAPWLGYPVKLVVGTWIFLPLKYCPAYYSFNNSDKRNHLIMLAGWILAIGLFVKVSVGNILLILF